MLASSFPDTCISLKKVFSFDSHIFNWEKKTSDISIFCPDDQEMSGSLNLSLFHGRMLFHSYTWWIKAFTRRLQRRKTRQDNVSAFAFGNEELKIGSVLSCWRKWYHTFSKPLLALKIRTAVTTAQLPFQTCRKKLPQMSVALSSPIGPKTFCGKACYQTFTAHFCSPVNCNFI